MPGKHAGFLLDRPQFLVALLFLMSSSGVSAGTYIWDYVAWGGKWQDSWCWNPRGVPTGNDTIIVGNRTTSVIQVPEDVYTDLTFDAAMASGTTFRVGGTFKSSVGSITGNITVLPGGSFMVSATNQPPPRADYLILTNHGTVVLEGTSFSTWIYDPPALARVINEDTGRIEIRNGMELSAAIVNRGTVVTTAGSNTATIAGAVQNSGLFELLSGVVYAGSGFHQTGGTTRIEGGTITTTLDVGIGFRVAPLTILGGSVTGSGTLSGSANFPVTNAGTINLGPPFGTLRITGIPSYSVCDFDHTGTYYCKLGGTQAGTQFDQILVNGLARLGGTLIVELANNFRPKAGDSFQVLSCKARSGTFAHVSGLDVGDGLIIRLDYQPSGVFLQTESPPAQASCR